MGDFIINIGDFVINLINLISATVSSHIFAAILLCIFIIIIIIWGLSLFAHLKRPSKENHYWFDTFFDMPISGFLTICISLIALVAGAYIFSAEVRERRVDRASATVLQIQTFLHNKYPIQKNIKKLTEEEEVRKIYYYGSTAELKKSLEILHGNDRQFPFIHLPRTELGFVKLRGAILWYANFSGAFLEKSNFNRADLYRANLSEARLYKADLSKATLEQADLSKTNLLNAKFIGANMTETDLKGAVITATDFTGAKNLTKEQIEEACWLKSALYEVNGEKKLITSKPPTLPNYLKDFNVHSLPQAKLVDKRGKLAYCP